MPKPIVQCRALRNEDIHVGVLPIVEIVSGHPFHKDGTIVLCSRVIRVDTIGYYVVEFETMNTIYEIVP